jgi:hypothetical protein
MGRVVIGVCGAVIVTMICVGALFSSGVPIPGGFVACYIKISG